MTFISYSHNYKGQYPISKVEYAKETPRTKGIISKGFDNKYLFPFLAMLSNTPFISHLPAFTSRAGLFLSDKRLSSLTEKARSSNTILVKKEMMAGLCAADKCQMKARIEAVNNEGSK